MEEPKAERFIRVTFITGHTNGVACFADNSSWWPKLFTAIKVAFEEKGKLRKSFMVDKYTEAITYPQIIPFTLKH